MCRWPRSRLSRWNTTSREMSRSWRCAIKTAWSASMSRFASGSGDRESSYLEFRGIGGIIGQQDALIRHMMNKDTTARAYGIVLATMFAVLVTDLVYGVWPRIHIALL